MINIKFMRILIIIILFTSTLSSQTKFAADSVRINDYIEMPREWWIPAAAFLAGDSLDHAYFDTLQASGWEYSEVLVFGNENTNYNEAIIDLMTPSYLNQIDSLRLYWYSDETDVDTIEVQVLQEITSIGGTIPGGGYTDGSETEILVFSATADDLEYVTIVMPSSPGPEDWWFMNIRRSEPMTGGETEIVYFIGMRIFYH